MGHYLRTRTVISVINGQETAYIPDRRRCTIDRRDKNSQSRHGLASFVLGYRNDIRYRTTLQKRYLITNPIFFGSDQIGSLKIANTINDMRGGHKETPRQVTGHCKLLARGTYCICVTHAFVFLTPHIEM